MFSNYMENMSPFVKPKRPRKKKVCIGRALFFPSLSIVLFLGPSYNAHIQVACHFLNQNERVKHLSKYICHSKVFSPVLLGLNWNCLTSKTIRTGPAYILVLMETWESSLGYDEGQPLCFNLKQWLSWVTWHAGILIQIFHASNPDIHDIPVQGCQKTWSAYSMGVRCKIKYNNLFSILI